MYRVIQDRDRIREIVRTYVEGLHHFAENHGLSNVEIRCDKILDKMKCGVEIDSLFLDSLKCDLFADILGLKYYPLLKCDCIPPSSSPGYQAAHSIKLLDDHIFGGALSRKNTSKPIDLSLPDIYHRIIEKQQTGENMENLQRNMELLESKHGIGPFEPEDVTILLETFRLMWRTLVEADKQYFKAMSRQIKGPFDEETWEQIVAYEFLFEQKESNKKLKSKSDFKAIGDAVIHGGYVVRDGGVVRLDFDSSFISRTFEYTIEELWVILHTEYRKMMDFIPALIIIEMTINNGRMHEPIPES